MKARAFSLKAFPDGDGPGITITGRVARRANLLSIRCALRGRLSELDLPAPVEFPGRKDRLWEDTCLELFLGVKDSGRYWEINLSPSGHWNVFRFASYREGMREEPAIASLPFRTRREPEAWRLSLELDVGGILPAGTVLEVGVAAVVRNVKGERSHWALTHPGPRPDFHRRDGFGLEIPAVGE